jgi:hypothetical protein
MTTKKQLQEQATTKAKCGDSSLRSTFLRVSGTLEVQAAG